MDVRRDMALLLVNEEEGLERTVDLASIFNVRHPWLSPKGGAPHPSAV